MSPTRELAQQVINPSHSPPTLLHSLALFTLTAFKTYREFIRLSEGSGFRIHVLTKATASSNNFGPQSSQRFGQSHH